ncbi:hypothetical protein OG925_19010 [Streptomyces canus]|nr:hypothetical protein [Streptomyces canus]WSD86261.1 hypothetical protein OG925_19010 [Streptomyces canus]
MVMPVRRQRCPARLTPCPNLRVWPTADVLCDFLRAIGRRLGKPVLMDPEGDYGHPVLGFDVEADRVVLLVEPPVS